MLGRLIGTISCPREERSFSALIQALRTVGESSCRLQSIGTPIRIGEEEEEEKDGDGGEEVGLCRYCIGTGNVTERCIKSPGVTA